MALPSSPTLILSLQGLYIITYTKWRARTWTGRGISYPQTRTDVLPMLAFTLALLLLAHAFHALVDYTGVGVLEVGVVFVVGGVFEEGLCGWTVVF